MKRNALPRISQAELDVMEALWAQNSISESPISKNLLVQQPMAASEVAARLSSDKDWNIRTVKTLLSRLVEKGALETTQDGRRYLYAPLITREAYAGKAARRLTDRLFGGRAAPLVAHLAEGEGLSDDDIAELEALLKELKS